MSEKGTRMESEQYVESYEYKDPPFIPFSAIHAPLQKLRDHQPSVFIPNTDIEVKITDYDRSVTTHLLNPNLYTIELTHGSYKWTVKKRYSHIQHLHQQLKMYRTSLAIPFPTKAHRNRRSSFRMELTTASGGDSKKRKGALPRFPNKPESLVPYEGIDHRILQLESYLQNLLKIKIYRNHHETLTFLEVSRLSFVSGLGLKGKEGLVLKRTGSTQPGRAGCNFCGLFNSVVCVRCSYLCSDLCGTWRKRWLFLKETCMGYVEPQNGRVKCVLLFDLGFEISSGMYATGLHHGLQILNLSRQLLIKCWTRRKRKEWMAAIKDTVSEYARDFTQKNRHNSFAPERMETGAAWFVDGCSYMSALADALEGAQEEIFIADWWLSPEIFLKRPVNQEEGDYWRLDKILARKASSGVKVFVLLFKEVEMALGINSFYSKQRLVLSHPDIKVLRHPDHAKAGVFLWAHHEKLVVIDQTYAFLGGIDLCYGRWDDHEHRLTDLGGMSQVMGVHQPLRRKLTSSHPLAASTHSVSVVRHLAVSSNVIGMGLLQASQQAVNVPEKEPEAPGGPLHPSHALIAAERRQRDPAGLDAIQEHVKGNTPPPERKHFLDKMRDTTNRKTHEWMSRFYHSDSDDGDGDESYDTGKTWTPGENFFAKMEELTRRRTRSCVGRTHRMEENQSKSDSQKPDKEDSSAVTNGLKNPGPLVGISVKEVKPKASKDKRTANFAGEPKIRVFAPGEKKKVHYDGDDNSTTSSRTDTPLPDLSGVPKYWLGKDYTNFIVKDFNNLDCPYIDLVDRYTTPRMPWHDVGVMVQGAAARDVARHFIHRWNAVKLQKAKLNSGYPYLLPKSYKDVLDCGSVNLPPIIEQLFVNNVNCQVLRSVSSWSAGFLDPEIWEESIHEAYINTINNAKHYVYIENQFFITLGMQSHTVRNQIGEALFKRILRAHREGAVFRVYVVMPLLPGFEGEVGSATGTALHAITHWNYASISRGKNAVLNRLKEAGVSDPSEYISFYGLRTYSVLDGDLVTELIYVHSKLLIVDDVTVICGSANINDRSMLGRRDSEIAVIIHDREFEEGVMDGRAYQCGRYAGGLRRQLFREHLGLLLASASGDGDAPDISDPVCAHFYRDVWMARAAENTAIYEDVFHCIPTDKVLDFQSLRKYQQEETMSYTDPVLASKMLDKIKGHLVKLPLEFLRDEVLTPHASSVHGMMPTVLWT
ncbi:phospholipase D1 isoform X2 [Bacillus rossius redtenbacheri]|uniref:phospholipase D1 isoform X2 n=1 Tax=Bacillus rossius redtenbacheri TaxID=93214 RepID=UPI002FDE5CCB